VPERYLIDASVMAKWFNKGESYEREAFSLRTDWVEGRVELLAPSLITYEVCNSIWKNPNVDRERASSLSKLAIRLAPTLLDVGEAESSQSMDLGRKSKLTFYDAVYIVLSMYQKSPLVSADVVQLKVARDYAESIHISQIGNLSR
jgi:predicted nucleic acid-binding protein